MIKLLAMLSMLVLSLGACVAHVDDAPALTESGVARMSCDLLAESPTERVLAFSDPDIAAPGGTSCVSLGGGVFTCAPSFCLVASYLGTCPHCFGGGE